MTLLYNIKKRESLMYNPQKEGPPGKLSATDSLYKKFLIDYYMTKASYRFLDSLKQSKLDFKLMSEGASVLFVGERDDKSLPLCSVVGVIYGPSTRYKDRDIKRNRMSVPTRFFKESDESKSIDGDDENYGDPKEVKPNKTIPKKRKGRKGKKR